MAEKEYIERGEIVRHIRRIYDELSNTAASPNGGSAAEREKASLNGGLTVALVVETAAKAIPAADVVEVSHGEWMRVSDDDQYEGEYFCSLCTAEEFIPENAIFPPFCWKCGAKMDGGKPE